MEEQDSRNSVKSISLVMILTLVGKFTGLIRDRLLTVNYGSGLTTSAFLTASRIPRVFFDAMFASAISASFIPVFNELYKKDGKRDALDFASNFMCVIGFLSVILTAIGFIFTPQLVTLFADGYDRETAALCVTLTRIMFPTVVFTAAAYCFVGILQSFEKFTLPSLISVVANAVIIAYYFTFNRKAGILGLAAAFLIGWTMQAVIQIPSVHRLGFRLKPDFRFRSDGMRKVFALMLPVMLSTWVQPINLTINSKFASRLFGGAGVSAVELSSNLYLMIIGIFVLSVTNVIFPKLSKLSASNAQEVFGDTVKATLHAALYVVMPMTAGLMILSRPVVSLIYGGGEFDWDSVSVTARALMCFALGMPGYTVQTILSRVYFAEQNGKVPLVAGVASIAVNIALCIALIAPLDVAGLALASSAAMTVNAVILALPLRKHGANAFDRELISNSIKAAAAAIIMAIFTNVSYSGTINLLRASGKLGTLIAIGVSVIISVIVYYAASLILRCSEARLVSDTVGRLLHKKG